MNKFVKLSTAVGAASVSLAFFATTAAFADTTATNTGDNAHINANTPNTSVVSVVNTNSSVTNQSTSTSANTGGNSANRNVGSASIDTGNAAVSNNLKSDTNNNKTNISNVGNTASSDAKLVNTGDDFRANANNSNTTSTSVVNSNFLMASQNAYSNVNTGDNSANRNASVAGDPSIVTGDAGVSNVFGVNGNDNQTTISNVGAGNGAGSDLMFVNTGDDAHVNANNTNSVATSVFNNNMAFVLQSATTFANTGNNRVNRNASVSGDAAVRTGDAGISNVFGVQANSNKTSINGLGLAGSASTAGLDVTNTGDDLSVNGNNSSTTVVSVFNNNGATVTQLICSDANTGDNQANRNASVDGNAGIFSGNAAMAAALMANANANWTAIN